jgi:glycolate oxidase iron-sulfur subunit
VATGNIGCITQIGPGLAALGAAAPILHTVELIDWATGGPLPEKLRLAGVGEGRATAAIAAE